MTMPRFFKSTAQTVGIAAAYYAFGYLGLKLGVPPISASAVWPAAGIALGAVLLWEKRVLPGLWLGAILINLHWWYEADHPARSILLALTAGVAVLLQAQAGAGLLRRKTDTPCTLATGEDMLWFLLIGGASSLISAALCILMMKCTGTLKSADVVTSGLTWWVGDAIGTFTLTPLMLIAFGRPRALWRSRVLPVGLPMMACMVFVVIFFFLARDSQPILIGWIILVNGFMLTSLLGAFLLALTGHTHAVEKEVAERTASIRDLNATLEERIAQRTSQLEAAKQVAERANQAKSLFLSTMSHEIRTPLNGVLGMADLLAQTPLNLVGRSQLAILRNSGETLLAIVNDVLDFSKIEAGRMEFENIAFSLSDMAENTMRVFGQRAAVKGLRLGLDMPGDLPDLRLGDPVRLRQVMTNLVDNAVKFTEWGSVRLAVSAGPGAEDVRVEIRDSGEGMTEETQAKLFQPFSQADASTTRRHGGTGLGLAICRSIIEQMGGRIGVSSQAGAGSVFWFEVRLPVAPDRQAPAAHKDADAPTSCRPLRILLVEDFDVNCQVATAMLQKGGHRVTVAENGAAALDWVEKERTQPFDLILMDCQMPVMDGFEATRRLRERERHAGGRPATVVAMTANAQSSDREKCLAAGMDDYLAKPIRLNQLLAMVAKHAQPATADADQAPWDMRLALEYANGDRDMLAPLVAGVRQRLPRLVDDVAEALSRRDALVTQRHLHTICGLAGQIAADPLWDMAKRLESKAQAGDLAAVDAAFDGLRASCDELLKALASG